MMVIQQEILDAAQRLGVDADTLEGKIDEKVSQLLLTGYEPALATFRRVVGGEPNEEQVQEAYRSILAERGFGKLGRLMKTTGVKPNEQQLLDVAAESLSSNDVYGLSKLINVTGIEPNFSEETVQAAYLALISSEDIQEQVQASVLFELTSIVPNIPEERVQSAYQRLANRHEFWAVQRIYDVTHVTPQLSDDVVQEEYKRTFSFRTGTGEGFQRFFDDTKKLTGIAPSEETIEELYLGSLMGWGFSEVKELNEYFGTELKEETVQKAYNLLSVDSEPSRMIAIRNHTKVQPKDEIFHKIYVARGGLVAYFIDEWKRKTGTNPPHVPEEIMEATFMDLAGKGNVSLIESLQESTGIAPSEQAYETLVTNLTQ